MNGFVSAAVALALVGGLGAGWLLRGWWEQVRHTRGMPAAPRRPLTGLSRFLNHYSRPFGVALVVIALAANALTGFLLASNRSADNARDHRIDGFVQCVSANNKAAGLARDERAAASAEQTAAAILWLTQLQSGVRSRNLSARQLDASITAYLQALNGSQNAQFANPYPDPDQCGRFAR